jgi:hypothetical protein
MQSEINVKKTQTGEGLAALPDYNLRSHGTRGPDRENLQTLTSHN